MGIFTKKLHILKTGGTEETCNIYTTPEEVGGRPCIALEVDGQKGYVKLGSTTDANATHLRVEKDGVIYAAWKQNGVTIYLICRSEVVIQGERRDVDFSINTDKPCKVTIGNNTYTVDNRTSNGYEYKTTDLNNINLSDGQRLAIKVDLL